MQPMNQPDIILNAWNEQLDVFATNLEIIRKRPSRKPAHDTRVSMKKLRSYLLLCNEINGENDKKEFDSILLLFRVAGKYRDVEVSIILSNKHLKKDKTCVPSFTKNLRQLFKFVRERATEVARMPHETELQQITPWVKKTVAEFKEDELVKKVNSLCNEKLEKIKELAKDFKENAHEIRKLLKHLYYWVKYCSADPILKKKEIKVVDQALNALGEAQDYFVLQHKLKDYRKEYLVKATDEFDSAKKIDALCKDHREKLLEKAKEKTESLVSKSNT